VCTIIIIIIIVSPPPLPFTQPTFLLRSSRVCCASGVILSLSTKSLAVCVSLVVHYRVEFLHLLISIIYMNLCEWIHIYIVVSVSSWVGKPQEQKQSKFEWKCPLMSNIETKIYSKREECVNSNLITFSF